MSEIILGKELIPSAKRLIGSLRDLGYEFSAAVADLIDNSINAGVDEEYIDVEFDGDHSRVRIADNGTGMSRDQLQEAMRYGSERDYSEGDLGKFGLGLKTASLSQCRKLTVVSKTGGDEIAAFCWDLDHVIKTNRWELVVPREKEMERILGGHLTDTCGTVAYWQFLDRMLGQKHPYGEASRKRLLRMCRELEEHVTMVFHRFIAGEVPGRRLKIRLNDNLLKPWDPFARDQKETKSLDPITYHLIHEDEMGDVVLRPYILPPQDRFQPLDAFELASGPKKWNQQQGFYIYRGDRLIQSGGWCGLRAADEHTKLARISLDFSPGLDEAFNINVAKMRVVLPEEIREDISTAVEGIVRKARDIYDKKDRPKPPPPQPPAPPPGPPPTPPQPPTITPGDRETFPGGGGLVINPPSQDQQPQNTWSFAEFKALLKEKCLQ